jgi:NADH dehydrogenase (ubiquinone) 1 alpha subcomplex subunit 6
MSTNKQAPEIVSLYALNVAPSMIRLKIRQDFEKNKEITDLPIIDMLLHKNQQEYQETMNCWKQEVGFVPPLQGVKPEAGVSVQGASSSSGW